MRKAFRVLLLVAICTCFIAPANVVNGEVATSIGLGFSVGPININFVEVTIPWSIFSSRSSRDSGSGQATLYGRNHTSGSWYSGGGGGSSAPARPRPTVVEVELDDVVPKRAMQIRLNLLADEDIIVCPNGQRLKLLDDGSLQLLGSTPGVIVKKHFNGNLSIWNADTQEPLAMISEQDDYYVVDYMNTAEALKVIELVLGVSLGVV